MPFISIHDAEAASHVPHLHSLKVEDINFFFFPCTLILVKLSFLIDLFYSLEHGFSFLIFPVFLHDCFPFICLGFLFFFCGIV